MDEIRAADLVGEECAEWYAMSPVERFRGSMKLWDAYLALRALSSIRKSGAKALLMGGQACVFYGAG